MNINKKCKVEGCTKETYIRKGLCAMHYYRFSRHGEVGPASEYTKYVSDKCILEGCKRIRKKKPNKKGYDSKYCQLHADRIFRTGEPGPVDYVINRGKGHINKGGYKVVFKPIDKTSRKNGYILEHRYVMSQYLDRPLLPNENVHHKNGNTLDNRIENLELWVTVQPCGQRVEDVVKYAEEILKQYAPDKLKETRENNG